MKAKKRAGEISRDDLRDEIALTVEALTVTIAKRRVYRPKLKPRERSMLRGWMAEGITDFPSIRALLARHGLPPLSRSAVYYYRRRFVAANS